MADRPPRSLLLRSLAVAVALALVAAAGTAWWMEGGKRLFLPRNWGVVEAGWLYRSGQIHSRLIEDVLREHAIDVVIDLARDDARSEAVRTENEVVRRLGIRKLDLWGLNGSGVGEVGVYVQTLQEIARARDAGDRVLVHCSAGSQRTGGAIALYRMLFQGWSGEAAWREYLSHRNRPPDDDRLVPYLNRHMSRVAARLVESGALPRAPEPLPVFGPAPVSSGP